ncbi:hypothetical protein [Tautonia sociabilis]|uniref:Glycosyltransferase RgtA/B/C/D-like domain-containing protein n=1 Tax=Tautonia sociabilis TaxID=2080755 RepID=A0A432MRX1_9BACT|nr:hypothetical protein [Tautonia sociabilis]RUL89685.1 hypothetical protein TsocGM_00500 [Tautonia sociabilis]
MPHPTRSHGRAPDPASPAESGVRVDSPPSPDSRTDLDRCAALAADRLVPIATAGLCLLMLACWVPHYLTWPWWPDLDTFAAAAICWAQGIRPYRDILGYSFPGPIYLFYGLDATLGAGSTWPIYALDAAMVAGLGLMLALWSRRRFGRWWPGLIGAASILNHYTNLNFSLVAQRDWQTIWFVVLALLSPSVWPGRPGRIASALATAAALAFRPHAVLFVPALLLAVAQGAGDQDRGEHRRRLRALLEWATAAALATALAFSPLIAQGLLDDLVRNLRLASYGSHYSRATPAGMLGEVVRQLSALGWVAVPAAVALLAGGVGEPIRREARTWLLAASCVLLYKPLHPRSHDYLDQPRWVVWSVLLAMLSAIVCSLPIRSSRLRLAAAIALLAVAVPSKPTFCNPGASLAALSSLIGGPLPSGPAEAPPGYLHHGTPYDAALYPWDDYRRALDHLRHEVPRSTAVANLMGYQLAAVGATGHRPVFRNESGLLWKSQVGLDDSYFIAQLEEEPDSVVLWTPSAEGPEPGLVSPALSSAVERLYEPAERFGVIEVWRRKPSLP